LPGLEKEGISQVAIPIAAETREDFTVNERVTGFHYRFVVPGPSLTEHEWHACLSRCAAPLLSRRYSAARLAWTGTPRALRRLDVLHAVPVDAPFEPAGRPRVADNLATRAEQRTRISSWHTSTL
jgi:hypothetical protein